MLGGVVANNNWGGLFIILHPGVVIETHLDQYNYTIVEVIMSYEGSSNFNLNKNYCSIDTSNGVLMTVITDAMLYQSVIPAGEYLKVPRNAFVKMTITRK